MTKTWIASNLLAQDAVELGRFVLNVEHPEQDFYSPGPLSVTKENIISIEVENFRETLTQTKGSQFNTFLTKLLSGTHSAKRESKIEIESAVCKTYQLSNSGDFFDKSCGVDGARKWLERAIRRREDVYLTVGMKTLTDTRVGIESWRSKSLGGKVQIPIGEASGMCVGVPMADMMDVEVGASRMKDSGQTTGFLALGERLYAVQYRRVEFSWFSSKNLDKASLEHGNRWKVYLGARGGEDDDDIVDAEIQDYPGEDDLEGDCETIVLGDEEILFVF